ncbi:MAG: hypothetical protein E7365_03160 [Clostridiales bacterium]|nr:hypothetical protein [Clostridiales bacterium]
MKKAFKFLFVVMLVVLMLGSVVACNDGSTNSDDPSATPKPDSNVDPNAIFTNAGETYSFYSWQYTSESPYSGDDERDQQMRKRVEAIEEQHSITIEFVPNGSQGAMLQAAFQGVPDITGQKEGGLHTMMATYLYQGNPGRCLTPLSDHSDVYDFRNEEKFNVFSQYDLCEYNDKLWFFIPQEIGIHFECGGNCLVFNKKMIEEAGSSAEEIYGWVEAGTWTWDKFETLLQATTDPVNGIYGIERGNAALIMWSLANSNGTEFVLKETLANGQVQDSFVYSGNKGDRLMTAYDEFIKFADNGWMETTYYKSVDKDPLDHFLDKQVAFFYNGYSSNALKFIAQADFEYGLVPWPKGPDNAANENKYYSFYPHLNPYCVFRSDANVKGAVQILCKLYTPIYDISSDAAKLLYETEIEMFTRDDESAKNLDLVEKSKEHFRVFMYSQAPTNGLTNAKTVQDALFGKGEDDILAQTETAAKYFESIANAINTAIYNRSPYSWK